MAEHKDHKASGHGHGHAHRHEHGQGHGHSHGHGHGHGYKFNPAHLDRLRDPERLDSQSPERIWATLDMGEVRALVDIGAGIGFFAIPFARRMPHGVVYACDVVPEMLGHLGEALQSAGVTNVKPVQSQEVRIPLDDGIADVVFMANLHHELDHPEDTLAECRRLLRPGGKVAVIDWKGEETPKGPPVDIRIPAGAVRAQLEAAGFREVAEHPILPYHYFLTGVK